MATFPPLAYRCPMKWEEMRGDEGARFCEQCQLTVVNITRLTEAERVALLDGATARKERLCVAYRERLEGLDTREVTRARAGRAGSALRLCGATAFLAALAVVAHQASRDDAAAIDLRVAYEDAYYNARYKLEGWLDDVRVFFGGTPRYSGMVAGVMCAPAGVAVPAESTLVPIEPRPVERETPAIEAAVPETAGGGS